jgi:hypothetical protein
VEARCSSAGRGKTRRLETMIPGYRLNAMLSTRI